MWLAQAAIDKAFARCGKNGLLVYLSLAWLANEARDASVTAPVKWISNRIGLSRRTTFDVLDELEKCGLVDISRNERAAGEERQQPNTYTILSVKRDGNSQSADVALWPECKVQRPAFAQSYKKLKKLKNAGPARAAVSLTKKGQGVAPTGSTPSPKQRKRYPRGTVRLPENPEP